MSRIAIIGVGNVGAAIAFGLIPIEFIDEIFIADVNGKRLEGELIDLIQASHVLRDKNIIVTGEIEDIPNDYKIIIAAGVAAHSGKHNEIYEQNLKIVKDIISRLAANDILIFTNPSEKIAHGVGYPSIGPYHRQFGDCDRIIETKGYTNWGIASEVIRYILIEGEEGEYK